LRDFQLTAVLNGSSGRGSSAWAARRKYRPAGHCLTTGIKWQRYGIESAKLSAGMGAVNKERRNALINFAGS